MGQVVGKSSDKIELPATKPVTPLDLMATIFHMYGMDPRLQIVNNQGRPVFLIEDGEPIPELICFQNVGSIVDLRLTRVLIAG